MRINGLTMRPLILPRVVQRRATVTSAPPHCCIAGADGQPWPWRLAWLVAFQTSSVGRAIYAADAVPPSTVSHELLDSKHESSGLAGIAPTAAFGQNQQRDTPERATHAVALFDVVRGDRWLPHSRRSSGLGAGGGAASRPTI
jgi:hypothetical protein